MSIVRRRPLICFFILAFGLTLGVHCSHLVLPGAAPGILLSPLVPSELSTAPFYLYAILSNCGPLLAGVMIAGACYGQPGISEWLSRWTRRRVGWKWYVIALLCGPGLFLCQNLMTRPTELLALPAHSTRPVLDYLVTLPLSLVLYSIMNAGEEGGWRGFALPHLQGRYGPLWGSCILGVLWEAWHLQSILWPGNLYYAQGVLAVSLHLIRGLLIWNLYAILGTWIFNNTRGSLLPVTLWHASLNVTSDMERKLFPTTGESLPGTHSVTGFSGRLSPSSSSG